MPRVVLVGESCRRLAGGLKEIDVEADTIRRLLLELERRFPGLGRQVEEGMAIAIDGTIYQDTYSVALRPESEIHVIPKIAGGISMERDTVGRGEKYAARAERTESRTARVLPVQQLGCGTRSERWRGESWHLSRP